MNQNKLIETSFQIYFFFQVFKKYIEIPDFTPMDLEMAIFGKVLATDYQMEDKKKEQEKGSDDNPATDWIENRELQDSLLEQLIEALLPLISPQKKYNYQTWPYMLKKAIDLNLHDFYQNENPLKRGSPCGYDRNKNKIWHVGQTARLYFQNKTKWSIISSTIEELELYAEHLWPIGPEGFLKAHINTNIIIPLKEKREKDLLEKKLEKERQEKREEMKRLKLERLRKRGELNLSYEMGTRKRSKQTNFKAYFASESESEDDYVPRRKVIEMSDSENDKENESDNMDPLLA